MSTHHAPKEMVVPDATPTPDIGLRPRRRVPIRRSLAPRLIIGTSPAQDAGMTLNASSFHPKVCGTYSLGMPVTFSRS